MLFTDWRLADFDDLIRNGWPDVDPARTVLLKRAPAGLARVSGGAPGTARIVRYANTEIVVEVTAPLDEILVLNDVWHPWWRATVDGVETEILKANVIFRAVRGAARPPRRALHVPSVHGRHERDRRQVPHKP